ncbi:MAG: hypothetical protein GC191_09370 [Azospirillum sp.]|nr:hypothetical protein [Azospirillum sp.]
MADMGDDGRSLPESLKFEDTEIAIIDRDGRPWVTAADLARALEYTREDAVSRLYDRNADEFSDGMSQTVNLTVRDPDGVTRGRDVRIFSPRGAHLISMFAKTAKAKSFRRWTLDVLDQVTTTRALPPPAAAPAVTSEHLAAIDALARTAGAEHEAWVRQRLTAAALAAVREGRPVDRILCAGAPGGALGSAEVVTAVEAFFDLDFDITVMAVLGAAGPLFLRLADAWQVTVPDQYRSQILDYLPRWEERQAEMRIWRTRWQAAHPAGRALPPPRRQRTHGGDHAPA